MRIFDILGRIRDSFSKDKSLFSWSLFNTATRFNTYASDRKKLQAVFSNPALLKIIALQCDLFSLGKIYVKDKGGNIIEDDPFMKLINSPNPFQSRSQFLWDFMFWHMLGTAYCYSDSKDVAKKGNRLYFMDPAKLDWPAELEKVKDHFVFGDDQLKKLLKTNLTYRYEDGTTFTFPLDRLIVSTDLTNGIGNFFKAPSRIDALYKIISNSEHALDAKNINVRYTAKFIVGSDAKLNTVGLGEDERNDIRDKMDSDQKVWPVGTSVQIRRFVSDLGALALDEAYQSDFFLMGSEFNIPRDVLEAYSGGSTYENQEKARAAHVSYCLSPKGNEWMNSYERHYGYEAQGRNICMDWEHLPLMQVFEKEKLEKKKAQIDTFKSMLDMGIPIDEANEFLGTEFTIEEPEPDEQATTTEGQPGQAQGQPAGEEGDPDNDANSQEE